MMISDQSTKIENTRTIAIPSSWMNHLSVRTAKISSLFHQRETPRKTAGHSLKTRLMYRIEEQRLENGLLIVVRVPLFDFNSTIANKFYINLVFSNFSVFVQEIYQRYNRR